MGSVRVGFMTLPDQYIQKIHLASYALMATGLVLVLLTGLLPALLGGLLVYQIVIFGSRRLEKVGIIPTTGKVILLICVALIVVSTIAAGGMMLGNQITHGPENIDVLFGKMVSGVNQINAYLPVWAQGHLPTTLEEWRIAASSWVGKNADYFRMIGQDTGLFFIRLLVGMIVGGMVALHPAAPSRRAPLVHALCERISLLSTAFRRIVFSQVRISALNTFLTGIFLALVMPAMGYDLPLVKTMIAVTFIVGLLPIIGNIISNTVIVLIAINISIWAAVSALVFLVVIHKLEYFINAKIIGTQIRARAWEILLALLVMDSLFGIAGLVAAPIYYAYIKDELANRKLI